MPLVDMKVIGVRAVGGRRPPQSNTGWAGDPS